MAERLVVRAKAGVVFPRAAPLSGFVGYERTRDLETLPDGHIVPGGPRYRLKSEPEEVQNNSYYRRAIARGDLEAVAPAAEGGETVTSPTTTDAPAAEQQPAEPPTDPAPEQQPEAAEPAPEQPAAEAPPAEPTPTEGTP